MASATTSNATGIQLRKRPRPATPAQLSDNEMLRALREELFTLREDRRLQQEREAELLTRLQQRDDALLRFERLSQLSSSDNIPPTNGVSLAENSRYELGYKLKPDVYDGSVPLREFLNQFNLISRSNGWSDSAKTVALASCLRGKARTVLDGIAEVESFTFSDLKAKLELRFGEELSAQSYYLQFTNRKQKFGEELAALGSDLERLARLAYPECTNEVRDKIACAQFISALSDGFVKRTLQLEGINSLQLAVQRGIAIKVIQKNSFTQKISNNYRGKFNFVRERNDEKKNESKDDTKEKKRFQNFRSKFKNNVECWQCGAKGHYRSECSLKSEEQGN